MTDTSNPTPHQPAAIGPITEIVEGMRVFDAGGKAVGKVVFVKLGDPEAITTLGEETDEGEPLVAEELRERLLRLGFIKVDRKGLLQPAGYAGADEIDRVQDSAVHLRVTDSEMLKETDG